MVVAGCGNWDCLGQTVDSGGGSAERELVCRSEHVGANGAGGEVPTYQRNGHVSARLLKVCRAEGERRASGVMCGAGTWVRL